MPIKTENAREVILGAVTSEGGRSQVRSFLWPQCSQLYLPDLLSQVTTAPAQSVDYLQFQSLHLLFFSHSPGSPAHLWPQLAKT